MPKLQKELVKKLAFYQTFPSLIEKENSNFGKLLMQENLIFSEIMATLRVMELFLNLKYNPLLAGNGISIRIFTTENSFENYTLGKLIAVFNRYSNGEYIKIGDLKKYVDTRNKLTHKMFSEYSIVSLEKQAKSNFLLGKKLVTDIRRFRSLLTENICGK